jgi:hypothetical protein
LLRSNLFFKVKKISLFFLEKGKYFIDFKNGSGNVGEGEPGVKADVTISMNEEVFLKIFNRKFISFSNTRCQVLSKPQTLERSF